MAREWNELFLTGQNHAADGEDDEEEQEPGEKRAGFVRRYSDRAQFIVVTHQKRTMDAADTLYGVSMGGDGISRVVSRRLAGAEIDEVAAA